MGIAKRSRSPQVDSSDGEDESSMWGAEEDSSDLEILHSLHSGEESDNQEKEEEEEDSIWLYKGLRPGQQDIRRYMVPRFAAGEMELFKEVDEMKAAAVVEASFDADEEAAHAMGHALGIADEDASEPQSATCAGHREPSTPSKKAKAKVADPEDTSPPPPCKKRRVPEAVESGTVAEKKTGLQSLEHEARYLQL
eukprot:gnl/TRDRNA2_/TRDRNA2_179545_c0_seq1.p1 gnl/TRDRNA2_/TRDRNA2_179545_c0~~gnl/TRDRNA2_/TRDRNA2_179545_c0_seq1.p1  ORF type:complete len:195 (-),score=60.31 gnl/TRDRNA2_/TRDRNA2_179545_c0_seq1:94-678(-)